MEARTILIILIPSILSFLVAIISIVIGYKREKLKTANLEWETAKAIFLNIAGNKLSLDDECVKNSAICFHNLVVLMEAVKRDKLQVMLQEHEAKRLYQQEP